ncbi:MAG: hypothetical protein V1494_03355 [Candidatus Diapherotrites archaeon]
MAAKKKEKNSDKKAVKAEAKAAEGKENVNMSPQQVVELFEVERAKLNALNRDISMTVNARRDIQAAIDLLNEFQIGGKEAQVKVPIGAGLMVDATITNTKEVVSGVPGNVFLPKSADEAKKDLEKKAKAIDSELNAMSAEQQRIGGNIENLGNAINTIKKQIARQQQQQQSRSTPVIG